jgi:hypothetical protein
MTSSTSAFISSQVSGEAVGTATTMRSGVHGGSGRQAIVHQDHCAAAHVGRRTTTAVEVLAPRQFLPLPGRDRIDDALGDAKTLDELIVQHAHATCGNRTHRQLLLAGNAKLADDKDVQRRAQHAGDFIGDGHTSPRQRQHDDIRTIGVGRELRRKPLARFAAIAKQAGPDEVFVYAHVPTSPCEGRQELLPGSQADCPTGRRPGTARSPCCARRRRDAKYRRALEARPNER